MIRFMVDGPLVSFRRTIDRGDYARYSRFKQKVLVLAMVQGFRRGDAYKQSIRATVSWKQKARVDL